MTQRGAHHIVHDPVVFRAGPVKISLSQLKYVTFTIIGIALLWPWNCFLSASAYYGDRFTHSPSLVKMYSSTMMSVSTIMSTCFNYYLSQIQSGVNYNFRINAGLGITIGVFIFMAFSCVMDVFIRMDDLVFFAGLMVMVLVSAMATCLAQNGTMATVNVLGQLYTNAVMVGQAIAGTLPSVALIISILLVGEKGIKSEDAKEGDNDYYVQKNFGVFIYYITASLVSIVSIALLALTNHYRTDAIYKALDEVMNEEHVGENPDEDEEPEVMIQEKYVPFGVLWKKLHLIVLTIFLTFCITLLFPVFASIVESVNTDLKFFLFKKSIYIPFIYLVWNLGDLLGRILCGATNSKFLIQNPKVLIWYSVGRLLFIPLFMTSNIHPKGQLALIPSDFWYVMLQFLFGLSNGQLCTSCFMVVGDHCDDDDEREAAGGFTTVFLSVGLAAGSLLSYLLVLVVD